MGEKTEVQRAIPWLISCGTGIILQPTSEPKARTLSTLSPQMITHPSETLTRGKLEKWALKECSRKKKKQLGDFSLFPLGLAQAGSALTIFFFFFAFHFDFCIPTPAR